MARRVRAYSPAHVTVLEQAGDGADLLAALRSTDAACVYIVDAMESGAAAGSVAYFDVHAGALPAQLALTSSHLFGVVQAVELARVMGWLPPQLIVCGIEGRRYAHGSALTADVQRAVEAVAAHLAGRM